MALPIMAPGRREHVACQEQVMARKQASETGLLISIGARRNARSKRISTQMIDDAPH
jgi:hypothetical protein